MKGTPSKTPKTQYQIVSLSAGEIILENPPPQYARRSGDSGDQSFCLLDFTLVLKLKLDMVKIHLCTRIKALAFVVHK